MVWATMSSITGKFIVEHKNIQYLTFNTGNCVVTEPAAAAAVRIFKTGREV